MNKCIFLLFGLFCLRISAQFTDNFDDGNFSENPTWDGEVTDFRVDNNLRLQLFAEAISSEKNLFTTSAISNNATWSFKIFMGFNPSSSNLAEVYLMAENENLQNSNALFLRIGNTTDKVVLIQRFNGSETEILSSDDKILDSDSVALSVQVNRSENQFSLAIDLSGGENYNTVDNQNFNLDAINTQWFGVRCRYTATRSQLFYFDDFSVQGDPENIPPRVLTSRCIDPTKIGLRFNETLNPSSANIDNFLVNNVLNPNNVEFLNDSLVLNFQNPLPNNRFSDLRISNVSDLAGNIMADTTISFFCGTVETARAGDIVINEIMADPTPALELPEEEYVEIYNASEKAIALSSITFYNSTTLNTFLTDTVLLPDAYYVLCSSSAAPLFTASGVPNLIVMNNFSALVNGTDSLSLQNSDGEILDIVNYFTDIYGAANNDGGVALERINPNERCNNPFNFAFSTDAQQATPGRINSVLNTATPTGLILKNVQALSDSSLVLGFNQAIDVEAVNPNSIALNGSPLISFTQILDAPNTYRISFVSWPEEGVNATLQINNLAACLSGVLDSSINISIPVSSKGLELKLTELMIDPNPSVSLPLAEYIELYNSADYPVNLADYRLEKRSSSSNLPNHLLEPKSYTILVSNSDTALFTDFEHVGISSFPGLTNASDSLALVHAATGLSDVVQYNLSFYQDRDKDDGGFSLENIHPDDNCLGAINFMASQDARGGTPSQENSIFNPSSNVSLPIIKDAVLNGENLQLIWDRPIFFNNNFSPSNLEIIPQTPAFLEGINLDTLNVLLPSLSNGTLYTIEVSNIEDCLGNTAIGENISITPARLPLPGELIFTEIMADPTPSLGLPENEYLELYNRSSDAIQLSGLCLNGRDLESTISLLPGEYAILGSSNLVLEGVKNLIASPNITQTLLTNAGRDVVLSLCSTNEVISRVDYKDLWHDNKGARDGGRSLELLNTQLTCYNHPQYWKSSIDNNGGTPGKANSQSRDEFLNAEESLLFYKNQTLSVSFSAPISLSGLSSELLEMSDSVSLNTEENILRFHLRNELPEALSTYNVALSNCNSTENISTKLQVNKPREAFGSKVLINEIMFDPNTGLNEYVELYNAEEASVSLNACFLNVNEPEFTGTRLDTNGLMMPGKSYVLLSRDTLGQAGFYPKQNSKRWYANFSLPSLPNANVFLALQDPFGQIIDSVNYSNDLHYDLLSITKGVALERISTLSFANTSDAFTSAAQSVNYGTPGTENSQKISSENQINGRLSLSDSYISANGDGFQDAINIQYTTTGTPELISILVYDRAGQVVKTIAKDYLTGNENNFIWTGDSDFNYVPEAGAYILVLHVDSERKRSADIKRVITLSR